MRATHSHRQPLRPALPFRCLGMEQGIDSPSVICGMKETHTGIRQLAEHPKNFNARQFIPIYREKLS